MSFEYYWGELQCNFISGLLKKLECNKIRYFILRNYELLPEQNIGKDVDLVIAPGCYKATKHVMLEVMREMDIQNYDLQQFDRMRCWYIMDYNKNFAIHIDIIENEVYKGFEYFPFDWLYGNCERYKGFTVLNKPIDTLMLLVQNLVAYKCLKEKYRAVIEERYAVFKEIIDAQVLKFWGNKVGGNLIALLEMSDFDSVVRLAPKLEKTAMKRIFFKRPFRTLKNIGRFLLGKSYRIIGCPKRFLRFFAVEAPDGTGKTTFINSLILQLRKFYVSPDDFFCVHHFRPSLLPNLGAVGEKAGVMRQDKNFSVPHRAKPAGFLSSLVRMSYYWLDYLVGVPLSLRKDEVRCGKYSIYDRYVYDFLVDPRRSRIKLPYWLRLLFAKSVRQPRLVFVLQAPANTIYKRKQELEIDEIDRQLVEYRKLSRFGKRVHFLDATKMPEEIARDAAKIIIDNFTTRPK